MSKLPIATFRQYLLANKKVVDMFFEDGKANRLSMAICNDGTDVVVSSERPSRAMMGHLRQCSKDGTSSGLDLFCLNRAVADGVKMYRPSAEECEAVASVDLNVRLDEYSQPFDTFVVELPEAAQHAYAIGGGVRPVAVASHFDRGAAWLIYCVCFSDRTITTSIQRGLGETVSEFFGKAKLDPQLPNLHKVASIAANCCMLMTHFGIREKGYANPDHARTLLDRIRKGDRVSENEADLRMVPQVYGFDQTIQLFSRERSVADPKGGGGASPAPHWRRGHFRMQPHGPGGTLRKKVFVRPVLVNSSGLMGDASDTSVTYRGHQ